ncbi:MCE family protein [Mycobacterium sp. AZCC_0083]|uniref:MCE family protein n=1 Tax=Mycobacterium sp. AZCC_0083 TaxID=2735882 RepID=UPI001617549C|nr:MlaD family protein [Mycobacterium sp. AZCC_0083]MBB5161552.1 phospholipid/cholesterol/gamma-HCH transport system substrate-binding protein [Mycobacterium sp. AZCC_0083]
MRLTRRIKIQLGIFAIIILVGLWAVFGYYYQLQSRFFDVGVYTVKVELSQANTLYEGGNVTYRGVDVGRINDVRLTDTGAEAVLQLNSDTNIPSDLNIEVHSVSAVGEQYLSLLPRNGSSAPLKDGDVIPADRTTFPPDINSLLAAANRGLDAIPRDNLRTVVDEAYTAVGGLGPDLSRLVSGTATLASDARKNLDSIVTVIDQSKPLLDSQADSSDSIQAWAGNLAVVTKQLQTNDSAVKGILQNGPQALAETGALLDRLQPTLPIMLANLVSVGEVAVTYRDNLEALLVLLPQGAAAIQGIQVPNKNTEQDYKGAFLDFNLNLNYPPPCTTGFFPIQQQRAPSFQDYPDRPKGNVYCRIPQDSTLTAVRGARNLPCETRPGRRAATVKQCESDEPYIPLNDGFNWKGDPNATLTGQGVPQFDQGDPLPDGSPAPPPPRNEQAPLPIAAAEYDPNTGTYVGPDGKVYTQSNLARGADTKPTWQEMLFPAPGN